MPDTIDTVFHYTSPNGLLGILTDQSLWATNVNFLNDPMEINYANNLLMQTFADYMGSYEKFIDNQFINNVIHSLLSKRNIYYIISFSEDGNSLPMWNYYGKSGYAIEFYIEELFKRAICFEIEPNTGREINNSYGRVLYKKEEQIRETNNLLDHTFKLIEKQELSVDEAVKEFLYFFAVKSLYFKDEAYSNEKEWRLNTSPSIEDECKANKFRVSEITGSIIPYLRISIQDSIDIIKSIRIHPAMDERLSKSGVKAILKSIPKTSHIEVINSQIPFRHI